MQAASAALHRAGKRIGLVPTMGCLHEGHLSLVDLAGKEADSVAVSVFVNPTQFGPNEDFARYPRNFERDAQLCRSRGVDIVFHPKAEDMYLPDHAVYVDENKLSLQLCGVSRPGHFRGVLTVVGKLLNIVQPDVAVFGQKDAQQAMLIKRMARELNFPVRILIGPTIREPDGLAMSSRNIYLSDAERKDALCLVNALKLARELYQGGERSASSITLQLAQRVGLTPSARIDYIEIVDLQTFEHVEIIVKPVVVMLAVWIGKTRLIDNLILPEAPPA